MDPKDRVKDRPHPGLESCFAKFLRARARQQAIARALAPNAARARALAPNTASANGDLNPDDFSDEIPLWMIREGVNPTREQISEMRQEAASTSSDRQVGMNSKCEVPDEEDYDWEEEEAPAAANKKNKTTSIGKKAEASTVKTN